MSVVTTEVVRNLVAEHERLAYAMPIEDIVVADSALFQQGVWMPYFQRLRHEDPVHFTPKSRFGAHWSITKFKDIQTVDSNWRVFSSDTDRGGVHIGDKPPEKRIRSFIASDPPRQAEQRKAIQPIVSAGSLAEIETLIRQRTGALLDRLPRNETFDWVARASIELTSMTLATIFDFPIEDRRLLAHWSDASIVDLLAGGPIDSEEKRGVELAKCLDAFKLLREEKLKRQPENNLISMIAHSPAYQGISEREFLGNLLLLIIGGNETTRNSMSASVLLLNENPNEQCKLRENPELIESMVSEVIRFQSPILAFRRTATQDTQLANKIIREGERVVMWYISGNRDEDEFEEPHRFLLGRDNYRKHIAYGFGVHRCVGNRLAEMQLRVLWEEILARDLKIEVVGPPKRQYSTFVHGIMELPVIIRP
ncbi:MULTISPECIES: cytochrome P450 [Nitrobacteraceae]|jgi:cytochrome P450|uniref:Cytochrome P450 n=1 Tax=Afipia massiliensis TaxID=211460 RepID=A0A840N4Z2_9BRAD|nr:MULTISPECIES: cytochrome P450 [Nitrobacteraceae]MBB5052908.1 cytochrome P450 [Afipia massiliensis]MCF2522000.1 cytochrome P450 [Bradyrhizobium sp. G127]MDO8979542.1 cytochrome P450 [Afipia sp.]